MVYVPQKLLYDLRTNGTKYEILKKKFVKISPKLTFFWIFFFLGRWEIARRARAGVWRSKIISMISKNIFWKYSMCTQKHTRFSSRQPDLTGLGEDSHHQTYWSTTRCCPARHQRTTLIHIIQAIAEVGGVKYVN